MATFSTQKLADTFLTIAVLMGSIHPVAAQEKIRLSYSALSPSTAFLWIPREKGLFKKHGLDDVSSIGLR